MMDAVNVLRETSISSAAITGVDHILMPCSQVLPVTQVKITFNLIMNEQTHLTAYNAG